MENPIALFKSSFAKAQKADIPLVNGMALATVSPEGRPSVRMMLLKDVNDKGFVFYTNLGSRKVTELKKNPYAALCFWWDPIKEQIRVEGKLEPVSDEEADAYFATRPRDRQIGGWASKQSKVLESRQKLLDQFNQFEKKFEGKRVPRPPFWSGFLLVPDRIEFWSDFDARLHDRVLFTRNETGWEKRLLNP